MDVNLVQELLEDKEVFDILMSLKTAKKVSIIIII